MSKGEKIQLLVIDVDGTMTDAGIYYDQNGNELKKVLHQGCSWIFCSKKIGNRNNGFDGERVCGNPAANGGVES